MKVTSLESSHDDPKPSSQVLSLVSSFLAEHGFHSTAKALTKELKRMNRSVEVLALGDSQGGANLQEIVENWNKKEKLQSAQSSSDDDLSDLSESATSGSSSASSGDESDASTSSEDTSAQDSESESGDDEEKGNTKLTSKVKRIKGNKRDSSSSSSSSASSDSDADDERETGAKAKIKTSRKKSPVTSKGAESAPTLKRKARSSSPESSSSDSDSDSSDEDRPAKRAKIDANNETDEASSSEVSSSSDEESDDANDSASAAEQVKDEEMVTDTSQEQATPDDAADGVSESSSGTVTGVVIEPNGSSVREIEAIMNRGNKQVVAGKKAHEGARPTPLARLSAQATADSHISNAYQSYDYAERAYKDLSVTRGKGFTKEKNKKKRGSYRGGAIDISGGKGFKFDD
ncbi:hypothetical protein AYL99_10286 [Fonsecaea erecta]|uniref:Srp40 C-terminal domain-containing protein n=1 Tax=Fonsecaea erecta TaxID=1367422 RepID=A0A178Z813_9EURO|nr:hypothetical protein AYL99_10286 [Fonsecaea erecta]OAP55313.1 hypothetical protein AYL99_10286 [Fonsecaea erecta]